MSQNRFQTKEDFAVKHFIWSKKSNLIACERHARFIAEEDRRELKEFSSVANCHWCLGEKEIRA